MADGYDFFKDVLFTWRSTADWVKAMGVTAFGITTISLVTAWLDYRLRRYQLTLADKHSAPAVEAAPPAISRSAVVELAPPIGSRNTP
ncbi:hypothetical protein H2509_03135 [Stappia sp. F7233]|uniref:Uncharacterized protein n=1 Tax=Stappia albiluteola TaxID=2758565 RepID=A0A839AAA3_9HYPH|nr:hypothetical protein [Stappia albiluteola]MBA5776116.1 hypothetical protein [Stappia albiluteola]